MRRLHLSAAEPYSTRIALTAVTLAVACLLVTRDACAVTLAPGDIVIAANLGTNSSVDGGLMLVDPTTGDRTIISDNGIGTGPTFSPSLPPGYTDATSVTYVARQPDGTLLVADNGEIIPPGGLGTPVQRLFRVDPVTGDRTIISDNSINSGPAVGYFAARDFGSNILVSGGGPNFVSVDPTTGNRTLVSGPGMGSGPALPTDFTSGFAISGSNVFMADQGPEVFKVNLLTGDRAIISGTSVGSGPALTLTYDVALDSLGHLLVSDTGGIFGVDPLTGNRTVIASATVGTGPSPSGITQLALDASGSILGANFFGESVLRIDPLTGDRMIVSDATHGTGPSFINPVAILVVPNVPEPSTIVLAAFGVLALLAYRWRIA